MGEINRWCVYTLRRLPKQRAVKHQIDLARPRGISQKIVHAYVHARPVPVRTVTYRVLVLHECWYAAVTHPILIVGLQEYKSASIA
jgi:hypothetical protein